MAEAVNEGLLDKLKTAIRTSTAPAKARAAGDWFKEKVRQASASARMRAVTPNQLLRRQPEDDIMLGKMFFYKYDPKFAKKLPYWDMYPLVFPFERAKGGFYGINLHYLPPNARTDLLLRLIKAQGGSGNLDADFKLGRLTFNVISRFKPAIPCIKRYLYGQVRSKGFYGISGEDWAYAAALPIQQFEKADASTVWKWSKSQY